MVAVMLLRESLAIVIGYIVAKLRNPQAELAIGVHVDRNSVLGTGVRLGRLSTIANSQIGDRAVIGDRCLIAGSRIGSGAEVGTSTSIVDSSLCANTAVYWECAIQQVELGEYSYVASGARIAQTSFGRFCSIGSGLWCGLGDHPVGFVSTSPVFFSTGKQCGSTFAERDLFRENTPVSVGHDVWIGARVFIRDSVHIGHGASVGADAVVTKDVPPYAIVGGVPAQVIRYRFDQNTIARLLALKWWDWDETRLRQEQPWFAQRDVEQFLAHTTA